MNNPPPASKPDDELSEILKPLRHRVQPGLREPSVARLLEETADQEIEQAKAQLLAWRDRQVAEALSLLKNELREYYKLYPDANYIDISGYIVGFQHRPKPEPLKKEDVE